MTNTRVDLVTFGKNVREIREFLGMTRSEFAQKAGIKVEKLWGIETGQKEPGLGNIASITQVLNVKFERLMK